MPSPLSRDVVVAISANYYLLSKVGAQREIGNVRRSRGRGNLSVIMPFLSVFNMQNADETFSSRGLRNTLAPPFSQKPVKTIDGEKGIIE